jgi:lysophospholipase L1-like esterase
MTTPHLVVSRRQLLEGAAVAAGAMAAAGALGHSAAAAEPIKLAKGQVILFQGDSITDAGRDRGGEAHANHLGGLGNGYPMLLAHELLRDHPQADLKIYNRGISGNKVPDLDARWQKDCLDLKPALLSILIGVNDIWHKLNGNYAGTVESYEEGFAALLNKTKDALPEVKLVICEPFALKCGAVNEKWFPEFDERRAAAKRVADDAGAIWVPFQTTFDEAVAAGTPPAYYGGDGVHPSMPGHSLMAQAWRKATGV